MTLNLNTRNQPTPHESSQPGILLLSSDDWGWKTSKYHLSIRLSKQQPVLFVSSIGFRAPRLTSQGDWSRIWRKLRGFVQGSQKVAPNLYVLTPIALPFNLPGKTLLNRYLLLWQIRSACKRLGLTAPDLLVFSQNWTPYLDQLPFRKRVYYVVDHQAGFAGIDRAQFYAYDEALVRKVDHVICCSQQLFADYQARHADVTYLPHGVNYAHFAQALTAVEALPADIQTIPGPILLFFGHIAEDWVDVALLKKIAQLRPDWSIVLLGRYSLAADAFADCANIVWLGEKDFAELPAYCRAAQVGLIPFVDSELTRSCHPLKLPEYLAAGLPVVSTPIPEVQKAGRPFVFIAADAQQWVMACENALQHSDRQQISVTVQQETWEARVETLAQVLNKPLPSPSLPLAGSST